MGRKRNIPFAEITRPDRDVGNLNGMPNFQGIEMIAELKALAEEEITKKPDSLRASMIRAALSNLLDSHFRADHHDGDNQCSDRDLIRGGHGPEGGF